MNKTIHAQGSALLIVMTVMTGFSLLLMAWWQAAGWTSDLALVRQRYITRFYATEIVLNYGVSWVKKEFKSVVKHLGTKAHKPILLDGGVVPIESCSGTGTLMVDRVPGDQDISPKMVMVTATMAIDKKIVTCHRCIIKHDEKGNRFVVSHFSFSINH